MQYRKAYQKRWGWVLRISSAYLTHSYSHPKAHIKCPSSLIITSYSPLTPCKIFLLCDPQFLLLLFVIQGNISASFRMRVS